MKKALVIVLLAALLVIPLVGLTACGNTLSDSDLATIRGFATRMDNAEKAIAAVKSDLAGIGAGSDVEGIEADIADIEEILDGITGDIADIEDDNVALAARIAALENNQNPSGGTNPITGQVTVQLVDNSLCVQSGQLRVYSGPTPGMQYTFAVDIVNGTNQYQYVSFGLILNCVNPANATFPSASPAEHQNPTALSVFGGYGVTYTRIYIPSNLSAAKEYTGVTQLLFTPSTKVSIAANGTLQMQLMLVMQTSASAQWEGSVTGVVVSSTW